ncbi:ABC transporter [Cellulosimicrobium marinum]|uniref:ABC transporter n=1 Tax=Cellulosimicrobium marinum TaxID=1638992 RepID=UPI001E35014C|nr:ABC transporter [Cellulosimicrobium marinum]MCB7136374.1 ABC transporter [Cellulosimicrobium marinum]
MTSHDAQLRARTEDLARAVDLAGDRLDPAVAAQVRDAIGGVRERLALGVDHTVVALAGGTGSGKSSLFNRATRLDFADVGVRRPTTARVTACSWSDAATALLDWLEVDAERRITRAGELDAVDETALGGLVLLDLPDHDSVEPAHRTVVDRVLPLVDLLVWVVDPQKYADDALHSGYLRRSTGLEGSMVVALNQIDTVPESRRDALVQDMGRLLEEDGLTGVYVTTVSARTGEGLDELRSLLEQAVARRSVAASRVAGELDRAGALLLEQIPGDVPWTMSAAVEEVVDTVAEASGLAAVAGQVGAAVRNGYGRPEFPAPQPDAVALSRSRWLDRAGGALRPGWRRALDAAVAPADAVATSVRDALAKIPLDTRGPSSARPTRRAAWAALAVGVVAGVLAVLGSLGVLDLPGVLVGTCAVVAAVAVLAAVVCFLVAMQVRRTLARRREQQVLASGRGAVERVVQEAMGRPTQELLDTHRQVRELAQAARDRSPAAPLTGAVRLPTGPGLGSSSTGEGPTSDTATARTAP